MVVQKTSNTNTKQGIFSTFRMLGVMGSAKSLLCKDQPHHSRQQTPTPIYADHRMRKSIDTCPAKAAGYGAIFSPRPIGCQNVGALVF